MNKKVLLFCAVIFFIGSCSDDDEISSGLNAYDKSVIQYFSEIALGFEFGSALEVTRKWTGDMKIFVGGDKGSDRMIELENIITEINALTTDDFDISIVTDTLQSNFYIFFGSGSQYASIFPSQSAFINDNWGLFTIYWDTANQIYQGNMYVDIIRANSLVEKHLLREELTQSLGLAKDSERYPESIFQKNFTTTKAYASIDKDLIRLLYHPDMRTGLDKEQVEELLKEIILSEK